MRSGVRRADYEACHIRLAHGGFRKLLNQIEWSGDVGALATVDVSFRVTPTLSSGTIVNSATIDQQTLPRPLVVGAKTEIAVPAALPVCVDFESGELPLSMYAEATSNGRVQVTDVNAHSGMYALDIASDGSGQTRQAAVLLVDLAHVTSAEFSFWVEKYGYWSEPEDGVFISDDGGMSYTKIYTPALNSFPYQGVLLDLVVEAAKAGLTLVDGFRIKFQSLDRYPVYSLIREFY